MCSIAVLCPIADHGHAAEYVEGDGQHQEESQDELHPAYAAKLAAWPAQEEPGPSKPPANLWGDAPSTDAAADDSDDDELGGLQSKNSSLYGEGVSDACKRAPAVL